MNPFQAYLDRQLAEKLRKRRVVVWYDANRQFEPYIDGMRVVSDDLGSLPVVFVEGVDTHLVRYQGSYMGVRMAVESLVAVDMPPPVLIYIPGPARNRTNSLLMELEKGGECYEPQLKRLARNVLRESYSDGVIDGLLASDSLVYDDIVTFLERPSEDEPASMLKVIFEDCRDSTAMLVAWLADTTSDTAIAAKGAKRELFKLVETRLGFSVPPSTDVAKARTKTIRYLLVNEFRTDLRCEPPASLGGIPEAPDTDQLNRVRQVIKALRKDHADSYTSLADNVETELGLAKENIEAGHLGSIDTFRFEERALLRWCGKLVEHGRYDEALNIADERSSSFWVDREVARQAQWRACRLMTVLGQEVERIRPMTAGNGKSAAAWVDAYAGNRGFYAADMAHRTLEGWVAKMDEEPETETSLAVVRMKYEEVLRQQAEGFSKAFKTAGWAMPGILHQTHIYPEYVDPPSGGRVGYFLVDAMRYEMGVELARLLEDGEELVVQPAIAALPTITPVGMAALLPGAEDSFSVVKRGDKLSARIDDSIMATSQERMKLFRANVPDMAEMTLGRLLQDGKGKVAKKIGTAAVVVVRSQEIDALGEGGDDLLARQVMDTALGNIARGVRKLAALGIERFVITADHGFQFSIPKAADMQTDNPGGNTLELHRRCWVGHGGATPAGTVRVTGAELGYDTDLDFIFPTGLGVFVSYGGLSYHHGGISLQEIVIPVISLRLRTGAQEVETGVNVRIEGYPATITNRTFPVRVSVTADLFVQDTIPLRFVLISQGEQVGQAGMAIGAECDATTGVVQVAPSGEAHIGMIVKREDCKSLKIVVQHPETDAILAQSEELPLKLGI